MDDSDLAASVISALETGLLAQVDWVGQELGRWWLASPKSDRNKKTPPER